MIDLNPIPSNNTEKKFVLPLQNVPVQTEGLPHLLEIMKRDRFQTRTCRRIEQDYKLTYSIQFKNVNLWAGNSRNWTQFCD